MQDYTHNPHLLSINALYKGDHMHFIVSVDLPGIGDDVINQAVPPGGDLCIALGQVEACDLPKRGRLGCEIFASGGLRLRVPCIT